MEVDNSEDCTTSTIPNTSDEDIFASSEKSDLDFVTSTSLETPGISTPKCSSSKLDKDKHWRGTPINHLTRNTGKSQYPPVVVSTHHTVLFKLPVKEGEVPKPWPEKPVDVWDQNHVRMPHSASSLYPVTSTKLRRRWELVLESLSTPIYTSPQLKAAILHYNSKYSDRWDFQILHSFFSKTLEDIETEYFFAKVMPKVIELAVSLPTLVTSGVPLLRRHATHSISLTQQQISCLLANAFLCTFPRRNTSKKDSEYSSFPGINFNRLFNGDFAKEPRIPCLHEKLKCFINYFRRVTNKVPDGVVTYSRHYVAPDQLPVWSKQTAQLPNLYISSSGTIEDEGAGMLQMDFANKMVGGGVLGRGCVQEEIRFSICPELVLARLFTEVLDDTEALVVTGCERFSVYRGYSDDFEWAGNVEDNTSRDSFNRRLCTVVAIDATRFPNAKVQYSVEHINRELNKVYAGFSWGASSDVKESVATGNWGCGAFKGDACLKSLLQLMAAAVAGRGIAYFTFGDEELRDKVADMHSFLTKRHVTVGELWKILTSYNPTQFHHSLYDHIYQAINMSSIPSPVTNRNPFMCKKSKVQEKSKDVETRKQDKVSNRQGLNSVEIDEVMESIKDIYEEEDGVKPLEAKTLSLQKDKDLCLKRLSSSWTNLNESKKDFGSSVYAKTSEPPGETLKPTVVSIDSDKQTKINKKKKISDYFQPVSQS